MKICSICKEEKPLESFTKDKQRKNGFKTFCKECSNRKNKKWRDKNKEIIAIKQKIRWQNKREEMSLIGKRFREKTKKELNKKH